MSTHTSLSLSDYRALKKSIDERIETHTPLPGNMCHTCGGNIVKSVIGRSCGRYTYSEPQCRKCGRVYYYASNVQTIGEKEFEKLLRPLGTTQ